jgi:hypothetical protein
MTGGGTGDFPETQIASLSRNSGLQTKKTLFYNILLSPFKNRNFVG